MKFIFALSVLLSASVVVTAQNAKGVEGVWLTQDEDCMISIAQDEHGIFNGRTQWLKEPLDEHGLYVLDANNPNKELRNRRLLGAFMLEGFQYDSTSNKWKSGTVYDPTTGKTYKGILRVSDDLQQLHLRGYIGISLIGREVVWTRVE